MAVAANSMLPGKSMSSQAFENVGPLWRDKFQRRLPPLPLPRSCEFNDVDNQASNKVVVFRLIDSLLPARCGGFSSPLFLRNSIQQIHSFRAIDEMSSQVAKAWGSEARLVLRSGGSL